jgi:MFS family permease
MYSLANIFNGMVTSIEWYAALRFISGFGLAGELGAGITLVSETMTKERRGIGTMIVASVGVFGAVVAGFMGGVITDWRWSFYIGGAMGLLLLILRIGILESGMFEAVKNTSVSKGNFLDLFKTRARAGQYLSVIMVAVPVWYVMGILVAFSPEIFTSMNVTSFSPDPGKSIMYAYLGITAGDVVSGFLSQLLKSRKKALAVFMILTLLSIVLYFTLAIRSEVYYYSIITIIGFATGYWAVFMSTAAELFGTNIRATATTTAPNFVRGSVIILSLLFKFFEKYFFTKDGVTDTKSAVITVGIIVAVLATWAWLNLKETFHKDLNYTE